MIVIPRKIKEWLPAIIGVCALFVLVFFSLQITKANRYYNKYLVAEGNFQALNEAYIELKKSTDREKEILAQERDEERKAREASNREVQKIKAEGRKKDRELVEAKAKIKELTPDELTTQLNQRVPDQFTLLGTEDFSLTRRGGELTLGLFMDGERCAETITERDREIRKFKSNEISFNVEIFSLKKSLKSTEITLERCDKARLAAITSKENLHKSFKAMKWKQFGKGAIGGGLAVAVILKLTGVI